MCTFQSLLPSCHVFSFILVMLNQLFDPFLCAASASDVLMYSSPHGNKTEVEYAQFGVNDATSCALQRNLRGAVSVVRP